MRLIFAGTPSFSVPTLQTLIDQGHEIASVYTQPDRKVGRGQKLTASPIKKLALQHNIEVIQPTTLKTLDAKTQLASFKADAMVVVAYGMLLPKEILETPKYGCLNIHASLLPRWRGAAPIQRAVQAGDKRTGVCIMQMDVGLDTGDVLMEESIPVLPTDTSETLHEKLAALGAKTLVKTLAQLTQLQKHAIKQNSESSTYAKKINKQECLIDWSLPATTIDNTIRAFNPWPVCESTISGKRVRFWMSQLQAEAQQNTLSPPPPGTIISLNKTGVEVSCGEGSILLTILQREGSKPLNAAAFINGFNDFLNINSTDTKATLRFGT